MTGRFKQEKIPITKKAETEQTHVGKKPHTVEPKSIEL